MQTGSFAVEKLWSSSVDWEPAIAVASDGWRVYQLTTRYGGLNGSGTGPDPAIVFRASSDRGATWGEDQWIDSSPTEQNDPQIVVAGAYLYAAWLDGWTVKVSRSSDRGATWGTAVSVIDPGRPNWSDKPVLLASPDGRYVYVAFNASDSWIATSDNWAENFSSRVRTSEDLRYWFHTSGSIAPDGKIYFAAVDYSRNYRGDSRINIIRSTDHGASWTTSVIDSSSELPDCEPVWQCNFGFMGPTAAIAADSNGNLLLVYTANTSDGLAMGLWARTSIDGVSWSTRFSVSNSREGTHHAFPALAAGPSTFALAWQDTRKGISSWNTWYRRSSDGGHTWSPEHLLSDRADGAAYKNIDGYAFPYGDYIAISIDSSGTEHIIWGEGESFAGRGGTWHTRRTALFTEGFESGSTNGWRRIETGSVHIQSKSLVSE